LFAIRNIIVASVSTACVLVVGCYTKKITWHGMRHAATTTMLNPGASNKVVQEILGHPGPTIAMGTYAHVDLKEQRDAVKTVATILLPYFSDGGNYANQLE
jgi:site-specific recombinase XerD